MKNVLDYNIEELNNLSIEELEHLYSLAEDGENEYNTRQLVEKTLMNALFGATANQFFPLFNEEMASAITGNGRYFIRKLGRNIEEKLQSMLKSTKNYVIYSDTDSCIGSTLVQTDKGQTKIEDLYESLSGSIETRSKDNFIKHIKTPIKAASVNSNKELEYNNINYVMKHKVKKRMFKIKCNGDEVVITEDHSMIVLRDEEIIEIKPKEVLKTDKLIKFNIENRLKIENEFEIIDLGIQEEWVYDIEVQNNHNFFGNNILIHNSVYFQIEPFVDMYLEKNPNSSINETVDWVDSFEKKVIQPIIKQTVDDFCTELNAYNKDKIAADREIISDVGIFSAKKKYIARVRDSEGTRYPENDPYLKVMGLEIAKSSTPTWSKKKLKESIHIILDNEYDDLMKWVSSIKSDFAKGDLNTIAQVGSASNLDYDLEKSTGIPMGSRAALCHNSYLKSSGLDGKYSLIQAGDKSKRLFLTVPNKLKTNIVAYNSDNFTNEIADVIDYDTNFDKGFLNALQLMVNPLGWDLSKKTETLEDW